MVSVNVDLTKKRHPIKGGMGASWHAMSREIPLENEKYDYPVRLINPRGSGYGGNPPVSDKKGWQQIYQYAEWLGLNWLRVELSQRMYEPQRKVFDWDNEEMQALYNILDWCESNQADVFLQQMWGDVEWNAHEGVHPLLSAPKSIDDFAEGIAELLHYLTVKKGYSCIKYFCIVNEPPGGTWGYWWCYGSGSGSITPALKRLHQELKKKNINIPIAGPDWTSLPPFDPDKIDFDDYIGAYDIHSYFGVGKEGEKILSDWVKWAHERGKPFFLTEFGNMKLGWGTDNPAPKSFDAALSNAEDIIRGLCQGVDAFNRWSFTNRGNMDGQWQLIQTYDRENKTYVREIKPEREAFYGYGILTRFIAKYASVIEIDDSISGNNGNLFIVALQNPDNSLVISLLNQNENEKQVSLSFSDSQLIDNLFLYQVSKEIILTEKDPVSPKTLKHDQGVFTCTLPGKSISTITDIYLEPDQPGIIAK